MFRSINIRRIKDLIKRNHKKDIQLDVRHDSGLDDNYLFDFKNYGSGYRTGSNIGTFISVPTIPSVDSDGTSYAKSTKVIVKPIDVLHELETIPTPWSMLNLDDKITMLNHKSKLITQSYAKREVEALIDRLENRKLYPKFKKYFDQFQNTTDENIDKLLLKYELTMLTSDIFIPDFPDEAINVMTSYTKNLNDLCKKKPVFYVIAEPENFETAYKKRDPILLVQSPFGFYWQILGAWDKEMMLLSEL